MLLNNKYFYIVLIILSLIFLLRFCKEENSNLENYDSKIKTPKTLNLKKENNSITILDSNGNLKKVEIKDSKKVKGVISISNGKDSNGKSKEPTNLIITEEKQILFPEIFGNGKIKVKSFGVDSNVTVLLFEESDFQFEINPTVGVCYSSLGLEPSLGLNFLKIYFLHLNSSLSFKNNLNLNAGIKLEFLPNLFVGYNYDFFNNKQKISLDYCLKLQ